MDHNSLSRTALTWVPEGKRKKGRSRETWRRTVEREVKARALRTWAEAASAAADRIAWRQRACSPIGPLHDPVTWYKIKYTGEQVAPLGH